MKRSGKQVALAVLLVGTLGSGANAADRKFYLSQDVFKGDQALTACAKGYHMASLWEIFNVSTLTYDTKLGASLEDSGGGPPVVAGWIRTGFLSATSTPGEANCRVWTSSASGDEGTVVNLPATWQSASNVLSPWQASVVQCANETRVWCVQGR